jgi:nucleoside-diphosphate-sugar epimerase
MANLLVIGGTGFFGKSILDAFQRGLLKPWGIESVDVMARHVNEFKDKYDYLLGDCVRLHCLDITSCNTLPTADYVIHAAASTNALNYLKQPEDEKRNIQAGTYNYCRLALEYHQHSKIVFCSSGAVYGQQPNDVDFILENSELAPIETLADNKKDYAAAKRDAESAFIELGNKGLNVSIARCFAFVGSFLPRDQHFAIGNFIEDGLNNRPIVVKATRSVYRSYMYSDDLVTWLMTLASASTPLAERFNVGSDNAESIKNLAHHVGSYFNVPVSIAEVTNPLTDKYVPSIQKARQQLGLTLEFSLAEAIDQTVKTIRNTAND